MWQLAFVIFVGCKWLTWRRIPVAGVPNWKHVAYLLAWPGLDAKAFLGAGPLAPGDKPTSREWAFAALQILIGAVLFWVGGRLIPHQHDLLRGWDGMIGLILMLHFGLFRVLSCAWRAAGVNARPLMISPLAASRVSEFWGKRWNTAFRDLTHQFLFRPLTARLGAKWALGAGFLFSGLVHDLVISVPTRGGYGGPTLFFTIQAMAMLAERTCFARTLALGNGFAGRLFTILVLIAPAGILFHPPFVRNIILPFMQAMRAT